MSEAGQRLHAQRSPRTSELPRDCEVVMVAALCRLPRPCGRCTARTRENGSLSDVTIGIIEFMGIVPGPIRRGDGITPAVALVDPKFPLVMYVSRDAKCR